MCFWIQDSFLSFSVYGSAVKAHKVIQLCLVMTPRGCELKLFVFSTFNTALMFSWKVTSKLWFSYHISDKLQKLWDII